MVKTLRGMGSIPSWGTKIPCATGQLGPLTASTEPVVSGARVPQPESVGLPGLAGGLDLGFGFP